MLTEVMRHYGLARPPVDVGVFETSPYRQVAADLRASITGGRLIALTALIQPDRTTQVELVQEGGGRLSVLLLSHPGSRTTCAAPTWRR